MTSEDLGNSKDTPLRPNTWDGWVERFWFLRGVAAALVLLQLIPEFIDLSRWELLRAFHAMLIGWNRVASAIGDLLELLPFVVEVEAKWVNFALFAGAVSFPVAMLAANIGLRAISSFWNGAQSLQEFAPVAVWTFVASIILFLVPTIPYGIAVGIGGLDLLAHFFVVPVSRGEYFSGWHIVLPIVFWLVALQQFRGYRRGIVLVATFALTLELLYLVNAPFVSEAIRDWTSHALSPEAALPHQ